MNKRGEEKKIQQDSTVLFVIICFVFKHKLNRLITTCPSRRRMLIAEERIPAAWVLYLMYSAFEPLFAIKCLTILNSKTNV